MVNSIVHKQLRETKPPAAHLLRGTSNDARNRWVIPCVFKVLKRPLLAHQGRKGWSHPLQAEHLVRSHRCMPALKSTGCLMPVTLLMFSEIVCASPRLNFPRLNFRQNIADALCVSDRAEPEGSHRKFDPYKSSSLCWGLAVDFDPRVIDACAVTSCI